ncbi:uncharacterized protein A1O9_07636 [Exophiala aquamarina CBS 119918]|uniref:C2H2-type domain-containing protein n=1 Tax=Exophiala aquamarina CBS 119918 TaxID=1182545 RepID=A0A072PKK2_9EURO|nr:uncharacterized protein A1O9_07636 [Exophiala aquamarina CBS 119918]KEF56055.1 hypothetical protein A1O9_07636 [Exophiala aquamarina CBS 119918]
MARQQGKRFYCAWIGCTKSYTTKASLAEHTRKHTGELLRCPEIGCKWRGSITAKTLSDHRKTAHQTLETNALVCQWRGCRHKSLPKNMRRHENKCRLKPLSWGLVLQKDLPAGVRVNEFQFDAGLIDIEPQQIADPLPDASNTGINTVAMAIQTPPEQQVLQAVLRDGVVNTMESNLDSTDPSSTGLLRLDLGPMSISSEWSSSDRSFGDYFNRVIAQEPLFYTI